MKLIIICLFIMSCSSSQKLMHIKRNDEPIINRIIAEDMDEIKSCFNNASRTISFSAQFTIFSKGQVGRVKISSANGQMINKCLMSIFSELSFPDIDGGGVITVQKKYRIKI